VIGTTGSRGAEGRSARGVAARPALAGAETWRRRNVLFPAGRGRRPRAGPAYEVRDLELHHRMKRDAPSGPALRLADGRRRRPGPAPEDASSTRRHGEVGARKSAPSALSTLRGGDAVGEHTVHSWPIGERLELPTRHQPRELRPRAVRAPAGSPAGSRGSTMQDVLGCEHESRSRAYLGQDGEISRRVQGDEIEEISASTPCYRGGRSARSPPSSSPRCSSCPGPARKIVVRGEELPGPRQGAGQRGPEGAGCS